METELAKVSRKKDWIRKGVVESAKRNAGSLWRHFDPQIWWRQGGGGAGGRYMSAWTGRWWRLHVGKNYMWARIAQLPAADASTCRQCLVHLIHEGGILIVLGTNFPTMFYMLTGNLLNILWWTLDLSVLAPNPCFSVKYINIFAWLVTCSCGCLQNWKCSHRCWRDWNKFRGTHMYNTWRSIKCPTYILTSMLLKH